MKKKSDNKQLWSKKITEQSNALDLEQGVFTWQDPKQIAESLYFSAINSGRRKATPYQSAMSMLNFYINRAGRHLKPEQREVLEQTKTELRVLFKK